MINRKQISLLLILPFLLVLSTVFIVGNDLANGVVSGKYFWFYGSMGLVSLLTWKVSLKTMIHHPLGVGLGNFSGAYGEEQAAYFASGKATETAAIVLTREAKVQSPAINEMREEVEKLMNNEQFNSYE